MYSSEMGVLLCGELWGVFSYYQFRWDLDEVLFVLIESPLKNHLC